MINQIFQTNLLLVTVCFFLLMPVTNLHFEGHI
jgi:hypothetical protein